MKFGRTYYKHQLAEWADAYVNYAALKRLCKESSAATIHRVAARCIDELHTIDEFYSHQYSTLLLKRSRTPRWRYPDHDNRVDLTTVFDFDGLDYVQLERTKAAFKELAVEFDRLRWYGRVNSDAFRKIIRKISSFTQGDILAQKVEESLSKKDFAAQAQCLGSLGDLHRVIALLSNAQQNLPKEPLKAQDRFFDRLSKVNSSIPALKFWQAVEEDDPPELGRLIDSTYKGDLAFSRPGFLYVLFQCSMPCSQRSWVDVLLSRAVIYDAVNIIERGLQNVIAEFCWSNSNSQQMDSHRSSAALSLLICILDRALARNLHLLDEQDHLGRIPLHYACESDSPEACGAILNSTRAWEQLGGRETKASILLKDLQSRSPIQISIFGGHLEVTNTLIRIEERDKQVDCAALRSCFGELLLFAVETHFAEAVERLLNLKADINCSDALGQTPLYLAARSGNEMLVRILLRHGPDLERPETTKNWTPLIIASLAGFTTIADILLKHGASVEHRDHANWTAIDHASYRGHVSLAKAFCNEAVGWSHKQATELEHRLKATSKQTFPARGLLRRTVLTTESCVVVNLGSLESPKPITAVCLDPNLIKDPSVIQPDSFFSLGISMMGTTRQTYISPLPLLEDATNKPWTFTVTDLINAKLVFEIYRHESATSTGHEMVGRGLALLGENYGQSQATKRENLSRVLTVPLLSTAGLKYIGTVTFSFLISTPLKLQSSPAINTELLWSENGPSKVVGHRGLGQNVVPPTKLQIGENTVQSFLSAVHLGASYVELDVQLTKDHIPVVYHDFLVSETGIDSPMHTITHKQYLQINSEQSDQSLSATPSKEETAHFKTPLSRRTRTLSLNASDGVQSEAFKDRIKQTFDFQSRGCKGNTRGDFIHDTYVTFEQLLKNLPLNIAINIEIKYPMLSEAIVDWNMDPFFVEVNYFTDTILLCLAKHISTRTVILSSFSPDICILLTRKQSRWPVAFLTDSGCSPQADVRATSVQEAVNFAKSWDLDGVVCASDPYIFAPHLVESVKQKGLVTATYGALNDDVEGVTTQARAGVDIIIVNNVRLVSETLAAIEHKE